MHLASACRARAGPGFGLCRIVSRAMSDVAAGKKAAAIKAVDEWIKVPRPIAITVYMTTTLSHDHILGPVPGRNRQWIHYCLWCGEARFVYT